MIGRFTFPLLLTVLAAAPLPFASVHPWSWALWAAVTGALLGAWTLGVATGETEPFLPKPALILVGCFVVAELWGLFQAASFSPAAWHHPLWNEAAAALGRPLPGAIALDPGKALDGVLRQCLYGGIFWLSLQYGRSPRGAKLIIRTLAISSAVYAAYGLLAYFSGTKTILWYAKDAYPDDLSSTFINKNNYATYAGLGWLCILALLYRGWSQAIKDSSSRRDAVHSAILYLEQGGWWLLGALFLLLGGLLYSHSRGGFAATVIGVLGFCAALAINRSAGFKTVRWFGLASLAVAVAFFAAGGGVVDQRLATTDLSIEERPHVYELTLEAIGDQPLLGSGLGSFEQLFRFYRTSDIHEMFEYTHDSYLETAVELGLPATGLLLGCLCAIMAVLAWGARRRRKDAVYPSLGLGALILVGIHSLVDFSAQIPAVAMTFSAILGTAMAQSWSSKSPS